MRLLIFVLFILLAHPMIGQILSEQQKEFCLSTFNHYRHAKEGLVKEMIESMKSFNRSEADIAWYKDNIVRVDSIMDVCVDLVNKNDCKNLAKVLEKERYNIYAHPHNDTYLCYYFNAVMSLVYSHAIEDDREYYTKVADLGEYSKMMIEAVQANWEEYHPLYMQVLEELKQVYEILENQTKINDMLLLILKVEQSVKQ